MLRFGIVLMFTLLVVLAGGLLSIPFLVREPLPILGTQTPIVMEQEQGVLPTVARIEVDPHGQFVMHFAVLAAAEGKLPEVILTMPDHDMAPVRASVEQLSPARFRATGAITTPGRWEASIGMGQAEQSFRFILRDF